MSPEPSLEPSYGENYVLSGTSHEQARARDQVFDTLAEVTNAFVKREGGAVGSVVADLRREHPKLSDQELADEIRSRARAFASRWPNHSLTPTALGRHWKRLAADRARDDTMADLIKRAKNR